MTRTPSVFLCLVQLRHLEDRQLVLRGGVGLRASDDVCACREALSLIAVVIAEHVERKARPIRIHRMPHDVYRLVSLKNLIRAEGVQAWDEHPRRPGRFIRLFDRRHDLVIHLHSYVPS